MSFPSNDDSGHCTFSSNITIARDQSGESNIFNFNNLLQEPFLFTNNPTNIFLKNFKNDMKLSTLYKFLSDNFEGYKKFKKDLIYSLSSTCKFQEEIFRRSFTQFRKTFSFEIIFKITQIFPSEYLKFFDTLKQEDKLNFYIIIDLLISLSNSYRFIIWIGRNLIQTPLPSNFGCHSKIKCYCLGYKRGFFGKSSNLYWGILNNDNSFELIDSNTHEIVFTVQCDLISLSRSNKSIKMCSNPSKIDLIMTPLEGYDFDLWEKIAIRNQNILCYTSIPFFHLNIPNQILEFITFSLLSPNFIIVRSIFKPNIIKPENSYNLIKAFLFFYSKHDMINSFLTVLIGMEFNNFPKLSSKLFKKESYITKLFEIIFQTYGKEYFSQVLKPLFLSIDKDQVPSFSSETANPKIFSDLINQFITTLISKSNLIPLQFRHICSIFKIVSGLTYRKMSGIYHSISNFFLINFIITLMNNPNKYNFDFLPLHSISTFLGPFSKILKIIFKFKEFSSNFNYLISLNSELLELKQNLFEFIISLSEINEKPNYIYNKNSQTEYINIIIEEISKERFNFIQNIKEEYNTQAKSPLSFSINNFLSYLSQS